MSTEYEIVEEIIDVTGIIPAHLKDFENIIVESATKQEIKILIDGERLKGTFSDGIGSSMYFSVDENSQSVDLLGVTEKVVNFEHYYSVPKDEFTKPFIPSVSLSKK